MRALLNRQFGGLPHAFWVLWTATLINKAGGFVTVMLAIYLTQQRGLDPATVGLAVGLVGGGTAVGAVLGGHVSDALGRRVTLLSGHVIGATAMVGMVLVRQSAVIVTLASLIGLAQGMQRPAFAAMMIDVVPTPDRLRALNLNFWVLNLGFSIAAVLGGLLATVDFTLVFTVDAAATLTAGWIVWRFVPESRPARKTADETEDAAVNPYRDWVFVSLLVFLLLTSLVYSQISSMLPVAMVDQGLGPETFGVVLSINGFLIVAGQLFMPRIVRRFDRSRVLAFAALLYGTGFGLFAFAHAPFGFALGVSVITLGEMFRAPPLATLTADLSPVHGRGRYQGAANLPWGVAVLVGAAAGGAIYQVLPGLLWATTFAIGLLAAVIALATGNAVRRRVNDLAADQPAELSTDRQ